MPCFVRGSATKKFWNRFFKYEAPITQIYYEMSELLLSDGRLGLIGLGLFGNIEKLKEFVEKTSSAKQITAFELDYTSDMAPQNLFGAVYSQPTRDNWETSLHKFVQQLHPAELDLTLGGAVSSTTTYLKAAPTLASPRVPSATP